MYDGRKFVSILSNISLRKELYGSVCMCVCLGVGGRDGGRKFAERETRNLRWNLVGLYL